MTHFSHWLKWCVLPGKGKNKFWYSKKNKNDVVLSLKSAEIWVSQSRLSIDPPSKQKTPSHNLERIVRDLEVRKHIFYPDFVPIDRAKRCWIISSGNLCQFPVQNFKSKQGRNRGLNLSYGQTNQIKYTL